MASSPQITDRAKRYRAQKNVTGPRVCVICGSKDAIDVMHLTGNENHGEPENLAYGCRSCNAMLGAAFRELGAGRPTNQYNPAKHSIPTFEQYSWAVTNGTRKHYVRGTGWVPGEKDEAGAIIHATPKYKRIEYAKRIARSATQTKRARADERWNPASYRGFSVAKLESIRPHVAVLTSDNDWLVRDRGRRELAEVDHALALARKREAKKGNPGPSKKWGREIVLYEGDSLEQARGYLRRAVAGGRYIGLQMFGRTGAWHVTAESVRNAAVGSGKSKSERMAYLEKDARKILGAPAKYTPAEVQWAKDVLGRRGNPSIFDFEDANRAGRQRIRELGGNHVKFSADTVRSQFDIWWQYNAEGQGSKSKNFAAYSRGFKQKLNPAAGAAEAFEEFHGFKPSSVTVVTKKVHHHEHLAEAGKLKHLDVWGIDERGHKISGFKGSLLAFNEERNQLFVEGGDQSIDLSDYGIARPHELETLGRLTDIGYQTNKTHLGDEGGEAIYVHKFRTTNEGGKHVIVRIARYPDLIYDVRNEQLLFSGGSYEILREGIDK